MSDLEALAKDYSSEVFDVKDVDSAKKIILTAHRDLTTDDRWETETPYLMDLISQYLPTKITPDSWIIDFGCGIGRMSKALIDRWDCNVLGVDISRSMSELAVKYVDSPKFYTSSPSILDRFSGFDAAISIWVLQHSLDLKSDINRIFRSLKDSGSLFVVNAKTRLVPVASPLGKWADDGLDIQELLGTPIRQGVLDSKIVSQDVSNQTFWAVYTND